MASAGYALAPVTIERNPATGRKMPTYGALWSKVSTTDPDTITEWLSDPRRSTLVDCTASAVLVVDLDVKAHPDPERAVDGIATWAELGLPVSPMRVETPSGGQHHYWRMPDPALINSEGLIGLGVDTRGVGGHVFAPGAFIVDDPGPGYVLMDPLVPAAELPTLPDVVAALLRSAPVDRGPKAPRADGASHDVAWVEAQINEHLDAIREHRTNQGGFRARLRGAALILGRGVAGGVLDRAEAEKLLGDAVFGVWGSVDADDVTWISTGLDDGVADPWTVVTGSPRTLSKSVAEYAGWDPDEDPEDVKYARELGLEVRRERMRREARALVASQDAEPLIRLDVEAFLACPQPTPLVPGLLYVDTLSQVFGPPGSGKSFLALDVALHLAAGRSWCGLETERATVHYVMAEGQAVNVARTLAWLAHHRVDTEAIVDTFVPFPMPVLLTEAGLAQYLPHVIRDRPALIVLDTKNAMMDGDENSASDVAVMIRAMHALRRASGACVLLVDHTGLADDSRSRGSNAVKAAVDTQVRVLQDRDDRGLITASVVRDKAAAERTAEWSFRLTECDPAAVPVPILGERGAPFGAGRDDVPTWTVVALEHPLPDSVAEAIASVPGNAAKDAARALARYMIHASEVPGTFRTLAECKAAMRDPRLAEGARWSPDTVRRAWDVLREAGLIESETTSTQITGRHGWSGDVYAQ